MQNRYTVVDNNLIFMGRFLDDGVWDELDEIYIVNDQAVSQYKADLVSGLVDRENQAARIYLAKMRFTVPVFFFTYYDQLMTVTGWPDFALDGSMGPGPQCQQQIAEILAPWVTANCR